MRDALQPHVFTMALLLAGIEDGAPAAFALLYAAVRDHDRAVAALLEHGVDSNEEHDGHTPLHMAASHGSLQTVGLLLKHGANPNTIPSGCTITPVHVAAKQGKYDIVSALLAHGADPNLPNGDRVFTSPLLAAAKRGFVRIVKILLEAGAAVACKTIDGYTVLHVAAQFRQAAAARCIIDFLGFGRERTRLLCAESNGGSTALMFAAHANDVSTVRALAQDVTVNQRERTHGVQAITVSVARGSVGVTRALLEANADPGSAPTVSPYATLLRTAAARGFVDIVRLLLSFGADACAPLLAPPSLTPIWAAASSGHAKIVALLAVHGAPLAIARSALSPGVALPINKFLHEDRSPFALAVMCNAASPLWLLARGCNPDKDRQPLRAMHASDTKFNQHNWKANWSNDADLEKALCLGDLARAAWTPTTHRLFTGAFRALVRLLLLVQTRHRSTITPPTWPRRCNRRLTPMPYDTWLLVIKHLRSADALY